MQRSRRSSCSKPVADIWQNASWLPNAEFETATISGSVDETFLDDVKSINIPRPLQVDISGTENSATGSFTLKTVTAAAESALQRYRTVSGADDHEGFSEYGNFSGGVQSWEEMLPGAIKAIVSLSTLQVRSFDTENASTSEASGFLIDLDMGIILSNRHVVSAGPTVCEAVFWNHEEAIAVPIYRDPIHDFGFFKVNLKALNYSRLAAIPLDPQGAKVGKEVQVVGNNAGEKLSILAGTLARLDRPAPQYGLGRYNDFNTFYIQAASSTSGGSSGSPVLDINGHAVALNAGGKSSSASSYFLPLDRVVRAYKLIKQGKHVMRGTLQVEFVHKPYDQLRRLGLSKETESRMRGQSPDNVGMLVVHKVLQCGPADGLLQPGDIILSLNGKTQTNFVDCENFLDDHVGSTVSILFERVGTLISKQVVVQDLHKITPSEYVEYSGGVFHNLSFQMALSFSVPVEGVFVANPGYAFALADISRFCLITAIDGEPILNVDDFVSVLSRVPTDQRVPVRFCNLNDLHRQRVAVLSADKQWYPFKRCKRCDLTGYWNSVPIVSPHAGDIPVDSLSLKSLFVRSQVSFVQIPEAYAENPAVARHFRAMCVVTSKLPFLTDGLGNDGYIGLGLVLSKDSGLILCDKSTVPIPLSDIRVSFGNAVMLSAEYVFAHPIHNFVFIKFDPSALPDNAPVEEILLPKATLAMTPCTSLTDKLFAGHKLTLLAMSASSELTVKQTAITQVAPACVSQGTVPKYRPFNFDCYFIENAPIASIIGGVLIDETFGVDSPAVLFWTSFSGNERGKNRVDLWAGISFEEVGRCLSVYLAGGQDYGYCLDSVELWPIGLIQAQNLGLDGAHAAKLASCAQNRKNSVLQVVRRQCNSAVFQDNLLCEGDLLLEVNSSLCTRLRDVEVLATLNSHLQVKLFRDKEVKTVVVPTTSIKRSPQKRIIGWAGAILQDAPLEVAHYSKKMPSNVYITWVDAGSPAECYQLFDNTFIMEVNEQSTQTLEDFFRVVKDLPDASFVRLKVMDAFRSTIKILPLRVNNHYFPLWSILFKVGQPYEIFGIGEDSSRNPDLLPKKALSINADAILDRRAVSPRFC